MGVAGRPAGQSPSLPSLGRSARSGSRPRRSIHRHRRAGGDARPYRHRVERSPSTPLHRDATGRLRALPFTDRTRAIAFYVAWFAAPFETPFGRLRTRRSTSAPRRTRSTWRCRTAIQRRMPEEPCCARRLEGGGVADDGHGFPKCDCPVASPLLVSPHHGVWYHPRIMSGRAADTRPYAVRERRAGGREVPSGGCGRAAFRGR